MKYNKNKKKKVDNGGNRSGYTYRNNDRRSTSGSSDNYASKGVDTNETHGHNDFEWYNKYPELLEGAANIDYSLAHGTEIRSIGQALPGFVKYNVQHTIPISSSGADPINVSGTNTFIYINKGKSNNRPYDPVDLSRLLIATADLFAYVNWMQRVYGIASLFSTQNRYIPMHMLEAMGVNFNSVSRNLANFRTGINQFIRKVGALVLPSPEEVPFYKRRAFLYSNVYIESSTIKDQMYFMNPTGFYKYDTTEAGLKHVAFNPSSMTYTEMLDYADGLIDSFFGDTDIATMCADIYNAYGDKCVKLTLLPEDYTLVPITNFEVLEQLANADLITLKNQDITIGGDSSDSPYLVFNPDAVITCNPAVWRSQVSPYSVKDLYRSPVYTVQPLGSVRTTTLNSRLKIVLDDNWTAQGNQYVGKLSDCGTEVVRDVEIYTLSTGGTVCLEHVTMATPIISLTKGNDHSEELELMARVSQCSYVPHGFIFHGTDETDYKRVGLFGPVANYAQLPASTLRSIHLACAHSLFALPMSCITR